MQRGGQRAGRGGWGRRRVNEVVDQAIAKGPVAPVLVVLPLPVLDMLPLPVPHPVPLPILTQVLKQSPVPIVPRLLLVGRAGWRALAGRWEGPVCTSARNKLPNERQVPRKGEKEEQVVAPSRRDVHSSSRGMTSPCSSEYSGIPRRVSSSTDGSGSRVEFAETSPKRERKWLSTWKSERWHMVRASVVMSRSKRPSKKGWAQSSYA